MTSLPKSAAQGYIYALTNASMEGLYKVGCSTNHPLERARQLSASTSAASPFVVAYHKHVAFPFRAESAIHLALDQYRVNDSREFFRAPLHVIITEFDRCQETPEQRVALAAEMELPFSWLFSSFPDNEGGRDLTPAEQVLCRDLERRLHTGENVH